MQDSQTESKERLTRGTKLGAYTILKTIGQGGFGITYLAERDADGAHVVIKENLPFQFCFRNEADSQVVSRPSCGDDYQWSLTRFVEEAQLLSKLSHPGIVQVLQAFKALGTAYYVMPFVGGRSLDKASKPEGREMYPYVSNVLTKMLEALEYLHRHNLLHRDIKPGNILMTEDGNPVLIDFGTARALVSEYSQTRIESPGYTPFEQVQSKGNTGAWTDLYALGATCYKIITGETPPPSVDRIGGSSDFMPLARRAGEFPMFPAAFLRSIDKAMEVFPKNRWQTAGEWLEEIRSIPPPADIPDINVVDIQLSSEKLADVPRDYPTGERDSGSRVGSRRKGPAGMRTGNVSANPGQQWPDPFSRRARRKGWRKGKVAAVALLIVLLLGGGGAYWYFCMPQAGGDGREEIVEVEQPQRVEPTPADKYDKAMQLLSEGKRDKGLRMLNTAADAGDPDALCELAEISYKGKYNMPISKLKAVRLYRQAAQHGSPKAAAVIREIVNKYK